MQKIYIMPSKKFFYILFSIFIISCATKKDVHYFQDIDSTTIDNTFNFLAIQPGDILDIQIKGLNPESTLVFQPNFLNNQVQNNINNRLIDGYLVGENGDIRLPILGVINTTNKTTHTLANKIVNDLGPYVKNPTVNIRILNFRVSILGEVKSPGTFSILQERISIPQALGLAGDLTINGDRNNVLLVRNNNGKQTSYTLDLTSSDFMESPYYYLKQNDIIYVRQNTAKVKSSGLVGNVGTLTSVLSLLLSLTLVITR